MSPPKLTFSSIGYCQTLRIRRICNEKDDVNKHLSDLQQHLINRNYKKSMVTKSINKGKQIPRSELLKYNERKQMNRVPLVLTYDPRLANVSHTIRKHMPTLHKSEDMKSLFSEPPIVAFRRAKNLKDLLVNAKLPSKKPLKGETGFIQCPSKNALFDHS